jgi:sulfur-oxidizing protein SoxX
MIKSISVVAVMAASVFVAAASHAGEKVRYEIALKDGNSIEQSLTGVAGDPAKGKKAAVHRKKGNCLACHSLPVPEEQFHGEVGPNLAGVGSRYTEGELRLRVVDMKLVNPDSFMPSFFRNTGYHRVLKGFEGKTVLTAQEVEDIVAYLVTLK